LIHRTPISGRLLGGAKLVAISPEMALRLSVTISNSTKLWLQLQADCDLCQFMQSKTPHVFGTLTA